MTNEEIVINNTMIADFMNWVHHEDKNYDAHEMTSLIYHKSWDWLMPVVEKAEDLGYSVEIFKCGTPSRPSDIKHRCAIEYMSNWSKDILEPTEETIAYVVDQEKINAVYQALIQFISWYNQLKTEHEK